MSASGALTRRRRPTLKLLLYRRVLPRIHACVAAASSTVDRPRMTHASMLAGGVRAEHATARRRASGPKSVQSSLGVRHSSDPEGCYVLPKVVLDVFHERGRIDDEGAY